MACVKRPFRHDGRCGRQTYSQDRYYVLIIKVVCTKKRRLKSTLNGGGAVRVYVRSPVVVWDTSLYRSRAGKANGCRLPRRLVLRVHRRSDRRCERNERCKIMTRTICVAAFGDGIG